MARYFIEVAYKGTRYSGFQVQDNANTIQAEIERAFFTIFRSSISLTGSSRTDAGVHALQNFFHFDIEEEIHSRFVYKLNAILPDDVVIKNVWLMPAEAHCRFGAVSREYTYHLHTFKNPFLRQTSLFYPYTVDHAIMKECAAYLLTQNNFFAFSKTNTQVKNFNCTVTKSEWVFNNEQMIYSIEANRFVRGMVRMIVAMLLRMGREKLSFKEYEELFVGTNKCGYSVPADGLCLKKVNYPENFFSL